MTYVVIARYHGDDDKHAYIVGVDRKLGRAAKIAEAEADDRGGKYDAVVYQCAEGIRANDPTHGPYADNVMELYRATGRPAS